MKTNNTKPGKEKNPNQSKRFMKRTNINFRKKKGDSIKNENKYNREQCVNSMILPKKMNKEDSYPDCWDSVVKKQLFLKTKAEMLSKSVIVCKPNWNHNSPLNLKN